MEMKFKKLELPKEEGSWVKRTFKTNNKAKSLAAAIFGAVAYFLYFYYNEGQHFDSIGWKDVFGNTLPGAFLGYFMINSPCAKGSC